MGHSLGVPRSSVWVTPYDAAELGRQSQDIDWVPPLFRSAEKTISQVKNAQVLDKLASYSAPEGQQSHCLSAQLSPASLPYLPAPLLE